MKDCENCNYYDEDIDTQPCCGCVKKQNFEADTDIVEQMKAEERDIIKALECCKKMKCAKCPFTEVINCKNKLIKKALNLLCVKEASIVSLQAVKEHQQAEIDKLKEENKILSRYEDNIQTEAYKEFADRLKEKSHYAKNVFDYTINSVVDVEDIDNILQELTERKEDEGK